MRPKKSLGQNFLTSQSAVDRIVEAANLSQEDVVLEVGPGKGILTQTLLRSVRKVIAVEKDDALIYLLKEKFAEEIKGKPTGIPVSLAAASQILPNVSPHGTSLGNICGLIGSACQRQSFGSHQRWRLKSKGK